MRWNHTHSWVKLVILVIAFLHQGQICCGACDSPNMASELFGYTAPLTGLAGPAAPVVGVMHSLFGKMIDALTGGSGKILFHYNGLKNGHLDICFKIRKLSGEDQGHDCRRPTKARGTWSRKPLKGAEWRNDYKLGKPDPHQCQFRPSLDTSLHRTIPKAHSLAFDYLLFYYSGSFAWP